MPADGRIVDGEADLDESMITGESRPVPRGPGDRVVAGTVSTDSAIRVRVDAVGDDTALAGIQRLVAEAQASRSHAQVLADRFAAALFYVAAGAALLTFVVWTLVGQVDEAVRSAVSVLVIACPHALGLAIPLVVALSTAVAARNGILVKDRLALERTRTVDTVLFDKTGTLTKGNHAVTGVVGYGRAAAPRCSSSRPPSKRTPSTRWPGPSSRPPATATPARGPPSSGPSRAAAWRPSSTAPGMRWAGRHCSASSASRCRTSCREPVEAWSAKGAAVLYLVREREIVGHWPWRTRPVRKRPRPSPTSTAWASTTS